MSAIAFKQQYPPGFLALAPFELKDCPPEGGRASPARTPLFVLPEFMRLLAYEAAAVLGTGLFCLTALMAYYSLNQQ